MMASKMLKTALHQWVFNKQGASAPVFYKEKEKMNGIMLISIVILAMAVFIFWNVFSADKSSDFVVRYKNNCRHCGDDWFSAEKASICRKCNSRDIVSRKQVFTDL